MEAVPGSQGFWPHRVLRGVGGCTAGRALEGYGKQYWPVFLPGDPLTEKDVVYRPTKNWT